MGLFGEPMNILNNVIVPLLIIIGISDATHLIQRYRDEVAADDGSSGDDVRKAAGKRTVRAIAVAVLLTSATTAVGLASLVVSKTVMLRHFGITSGIGVMVSYVVIITFVPALGSFLTPDLLGGTDSQMIANVIERQFKSANDWPFGAALSFILMYITFFAIALRALWASKRRRGLAA